MAFSTAEVLSLDHGFESSQVFPVAVRRVKAYFSTIPVANDSRCDGFVVLGELRLGPGSQDGAAPQQFFHPACVFFSNSVTE